MTRILLGPFNRVEGDLEVNLEVELERVVSAQVNSPLFRGFEQILPGRAPADALAVVPRICGICSVAQSAAAAAALADAAGCEMPPNGRLAFNLIQATENLADHLAHFYLFFMPDFARPAYAAHDWYAALAPRFTAVKGSAMAPMLSARSSFFKLIGILAGRWPHTLALQPGGSTKAMTAGERIRVLALLRDFRGFLENTLFGDRLESLAALESEDALRAWAVRRNADFPLFLTAAGDLALEKAGRASDDFMSYGAYGMFAAGLWQPNAAVDALNPQKITEDTRHAWLLDSTRRPAEGETIVAADKPDAYTWCKAPRYAGRVVETGALARQVVSGQPLLRDLVQRHGGSVTARISARMIELATILPAMERWVREIVPGDAFCHVSAMPDEGEGVGLVEAARGSLGHWLGIKNGRISRYQIVAPTTWNFSPRDSESQPGPLEQALVGLPAGDLALPTVQHVVRSFDPCMVCTVH